MCSKRYAKPFNFNCVKKTIVLCTEGCLQDLKGTKKEGKYKFEMDGSLQYEIIKSFQLPSKR